MGPFYGPLGFFRRIPGTLKGTYRVYSRYIRTQGKGPILGVQGFNLRRTLDPHAMTIMAEELL